MFGGEEKTSYFCTDRVHHASCLAQRTRVELLFYIGMKYSKQPLTIEQQISLLKDRGLAIIDEAAAQKVLGSISYFRLANYFRPMETDKQNHQFKPGATFENAVRLYDFDASLRELVFKAIARIEIALRTKMIHHFSLAHGAFWFADKSLSREERLFQENIGSVERELHRTREEFIKDHFKKYDDPPFPPAWKTLEVVSFGVLSKMYYNFSDIKVKKNVARSLDLPQHKILESWAASLAALRNCCAHHARMWNRNYPVTPAIPAKLKNAWISNTAVADNKLYIQLCCIAYLLNNILPGNTFTQTLKALIAAYPNVDTTAMGFPSDWKTEALWQ